MRYLGIEPNNPKWLSNRTALANGDFDHVSVSKPFETVNGELGLEPPDISFVRVLEDPFPRTNQSREGFSGPVPLTLNQRVPGSSPGAPTMNTQNIKGLLV